MNLYLYFYIKFGFIFPTGKGKIFIIDGVPLKLHSVQVIKGPDSFY